MQLGLATTLLQMQLDQDQQPYQQQPWGRKLQSYLPGLDTKVTSMHGGPCKFLCVIRSTACAD